VAGSDKEKIRKYYQAAWTKVSDELAGQLLAYGFAPKGVDGKYEIGNAHGQVYAYTAETSKLHDALLFILINPTGTGKLSIKLTFNNKGNFLELAESIKSGVAAKPLGTPCKNEEGRFVAEYLFYTEPRPTDPIDASGVLLETAIVWLKAITITER
jgi:hypothetical protein